MRKLLCNIRLVPLVVRQQRVQIPIPRDKRQICVRDLVPRQIFRTLLLQVPINDARNALDLVGVAVDGGLDVLLWVEEGEPGFLAKVGALSGGLEVQPGEGGVFFFGGVGVQGLGFIVLVDEVFDDGARLY